MNSSYQNDLKRLAEMIKGIEFTMLTTVDKDGTLHSRPMATLKIDEKEFDGKLWFFTKKDSPKVHSIKKDQHVNLTYSRPDNQQYVSISGLASIVEDKKMIENFWVPTLKAWFPEGPKDPQISLICVEAIMAEIWDTPPSKIVQILGFAKAMVTGKPYHHDAHSEHLDIKH